MLTTSTRIVILNVGPLFNVKEFHLVVTFYVTEGLTAWLLSIDEEVPGSNLASTVRFLFNEELFRGKFKLRNTLKITFDHSRNPISEREH